MRGGWTSLSRIAAWITLVLGGLVMVRRPDWATPAVLACLASTAWPLARAWRGSRGTGLRWVVPWAVLAVGLGMSGLGLAILDPRRLASGMEGECLFLSALAALSSTIAILNARRPGAGAWAFLLGVLIVNFYFIARLGVPRQGHGVGWGGLNRFDSDRLWTLFLSLLLFVGLSNFAFTRFWLAAVVLGTSLWLSAFPMDFPGEYAGPWLLAVSAWMAEAQATHRRTAASGLDRLWLWFRDHWGIVWALRVMERFNRAAESAGWPVRLGWYGAEPVGGSGPPEIPEGAEATLKSLLRRFADADRLDAEAEPDPPPLR